jgi:hypothetical protein
MMSGTVLVWPMTKGGGGRRAGLDRGYDIGGRVDLCRGDADVSGQRRGRLLRPLPARDVDRVDPGVT